MNRDIFDKAEILDYQMRDLRQCLDDVERINVNASSVRISFDCETFVLRSEFVPQDFMKKYIENIKAEIAKLEKEFEAL